MAQYRHDSVANHLKRVQSILSVKIIVTPLNFILGTKEPTGMIGWTRISPLLIGAWVNLTSSQWAAAQDAYSDPAGSGPILGAFRWIQGTLLGSVATVIAIIAVSVVGLMMLTGRMNWRYGAMVVLGCFILFGASAIVGGIQAAAQNGY